MERDRNGDGGSVKVSGIEVGSHTFCDNIGLLKLVGYEGKTIIHDMRVKYNYRFIVQTDVRRRYPDTEI